MNYENSTGMKTMRRVFNSALPGHAVETLQNYRESFDTPMEVPNVQGKG